MAEAFIYDAVRTPRGRGKPDGSLHEVPAVDLAVTALDAIRSRNDLDPILVEDVVLGCVDPVGEAGGDIARAAVLKAGFGKEVPGVQINRFCASGLDAVNLAAAQVMSGMKDIAIGGGVESMSRIGMGASGGAWPVDPGIAIPTYFLPQGISADLIATKYGFSRDDVDAYAVESQKRAAKAWDEGRFAKSVVPVRDVNGLTILARDEHMRPQTDMQSLGQLKASFVQMGEMGGFDAVAIAAHPDVEFVNHVHHAGNSSGIVDGAAAVLVGNEGGRHEGGPEAARADQGLRLHRLRSRAHAHRPHRRVGTRAAQGRHDEGRHRSLRDQRGLLGRGAALHAGAGSRSGEGQRERRRHRHGPSARRHRRHDPRHGARRTGAHRTSRRR